ncbi:hypothetical protein MVEN_02597200 [Mycena venus]|uniref:DUF5648 domain-containing protein n=1 Tax=Mycena venus TaxID=2733690 RepID=A0A8H6TWL5_9AGAR|nr:hypothetical protein MVEN_02597200 [Mycena venus]
MMYIPSALVLSVAAVFIGALNVSKSGAPNRGDAALKNRYVPVVSDPFAFIYPAQACGSVPFYHLYHQARKNNSYTISQAEILDFIANQGYTDIEIAECVLPVTQSTQYG